MTSREKLTFVLVHGAFHDGSACQQHGPAASGDRVIHSVDLHTGPITWQIREYHDPYRVTGRVTWFFSRLLSMSR